MLNIKKIKLKGKITVQPKLINWSNLYLGKIALKIIKTKVNKIVFIIKNKGDLNPKKNQPPKNKELLNKDINIIFAYSPKKKNAKVIAEYSTL